MDRSQSDLEIAQSTVCFEIKKALARAWPSLAGQRECYQENISYRFV